MSLAGWVVFAGRDIAFSNLGLIPWFKRCVKFAFLWIRAWVEFRLVGGCEAGSLGFDRGGFSTFSLEDNVQVGVDVLFP